MDKNIYHESETRYQDEVNITSDEESNYIAINSTPSAIDANDKQRIATLPGCDAITYRDDSKRMAQELTSEGRKSPNETSRPSTTKRSNPFSIESLLSHAEGYTD
ncbi:hypothetical protein L798_15521 [Zootermopsis nevadensis]|uniref:Uncharacterized protein n=2 Tax=Zootermopsis nevadensis TaxID=136037 RepID=A0A067QZ26_ZOONE|nr:hypothetical protein L798_15521 [Zootermopsis nevadensis]